MAVSAENASKFRQFIVTVVKNGEVWGVVMPNGWLSMIESWRNQGRNCYGFWSSREAAERVAAERAMAKRISVHAKRVLLQSFLHDLLEEFIQDEDSIAMDWDTGEGPQASAKDLKDLIEKTARTLKREIPEPPPLYSSDCVVSRTPGAITFSVDDVTPVTERLAEEKIYAAVRKRLKSELESCCDYHSDVVAGVGYHPLIAAAHLAFCDHRPLVLSPDMIWLAIAQGVSTHIQNNAELLRGHFVNHQGKETLSVECPSFVKGTPENPWGEVIDAFSAQIRRHVGEQNHALFVSNFSTTGPVERIASEVVMMEALQHYFDYVAVCVCGIPSITLEGSTQDWENLRARLEHLRLLGLEWWLEHLEPICNEFVNASRGQICRKHWHRIYKKVEVYGGEVINGWLAKLFPYSDKGRQRNRLLNGEGIRSSELPTGIAKAPFQFRVGPRDAPIDFPMEFVAGFFGVSQNRETLALRPKIGWAVRDADRFDQLLHQISTAHELIPPVKSDPPRSLYGSCGEVVRFHDRCDGANLFIAADGEPHFRILGAQEREGLDLFRKKGELDFRRLTAEEMYSADGERHGWIVICRTRDKSFFALDDRPEDGRVDRQKLRWRIVYVPGGNITHADKCPVVAYAFTEFLDLILKNGARPFVPDVKCLSYEQALKAEEQRKIDYFNRPEKETEDA